MILNDNDAEKLREQLYWLGDLVVTLFRGPLTLSTTNDTIKTESEPKPKVEEKSSSKVIKSSGKKKPDFKIKWIVREAFFKKFQMSFDQLMKYLWRSGKYTIIADFYGDQKAKEKIQICCHQMTSDGELKRADKNPDTPMFAEELLKERYKNQGKRLRKSKNIDVN